jgi:hypothetical protein
VVLTLFIAPLFISFRFPLQRMAIPKVSSGNLFQYFQCLDSSLLFAVNKLRIIHLSCFVAPKRQGQLKCVTSLLKLHIRNPFIHKGRSR